ncbi:MAG: hypothetical protein PHR30_03130 [Gallionellaceae bacterium]|nr:hypothetical protein [Gallionellaceae bacterium]
MGKWFEFSQPILTARCLSGGLNQLIADGHVATFGDNLVAFTDI